MKKYIPVFLFFIALALFAGVFLASSGRVASSRGADLWNASYPFRAAAGKSVPLWFNSQFCGLPLAANIQLGFFYPLNAQFFLFDAAASYNLAFLLHVFLAGLGVALFLSELGLGAAAVFAGGVSFMLSAPVLWRVTLGHIDIISSLAWIGFVFAGVLRLSKKPSASRAAALGLAGGMQILAGHPQYFYMTALAASAYAAFEWFPAAYPEKKRFAIGCAAACAGALAVSAAAWAPLAGFLGLSSRSDAGMAFAGTFSMPPEQVLSFAVPGFFGGQIPGPYWGRWYPWEITGYFGAAALLLAFAGLFSADRRAVFFKWCAGGVLILALGKYLPLFPLLYHGFPGIAVFRCPGRFVVFAAFSGCVLAAFGLDALLASSPEQFRRTLRRMVIFAAAVFGGAGLFLAVSAAGDYALWRKLLSAMAALPDRMLAPANSLEIYRQLYAGAAKSWLASALAAAALLSGCMFFRNGRRALGVFICCVCLLELWACGHSHITMFDSSSLALEKGAREFLAGDSLPHRAAGIGIPPAVMTASGIETADGYYSVRLKSYQEFFNFSQGRPAEKDMARLEQLPPMLAYLNLKYVVSAGKLPANPLLKEVYSGPSATIYRWTPGLERFYFTGNVRRAERGEMLALLSDWEPATLPFALTEIETGLKNVDAKAAFGRVEYSPARSHVSLNASAAGMLVMNESWYPGWRAYVNGREAPVLRVNYYARGVALEAGENDVVFRYSPTGLKWLAALSLLSFFVLLWIWFAG